MILTQTGNQITGTGGVDGLTRYEGSISGQHVTLYVEAPGQGGVEGTGWAMLTGTVNGNTMSGNLNLMYTPPKKSPIGGTGTFTLSRT